MNHAGRIKETPLQQIRSFESLTFCAANLALYTGFLAHGIFEYGKWCLLAGVLLFLMFRNGFVVQYRPHRWLLLISGYALFTVSYSPDRTISSLKAVALLLVFMVVISTTPPKRMRTLGNCVTVLSRIRWGFISLACFYFTASVALLWSGITYPPLLKDPLFTGIDGGFAIRFCGILGNPNQLGICSAVLAPVVLATALEMPRERISCWLLLAAIVYSVWVSGSRNGLLSLLFGCAVTFVIASHRSKLPARVMLISVIASAGVMFIGEELQLFLTRNSDAEFTVDTVGSNRFPRWSAGLQSIEKRPVLGQGFSYGGVPNSGYVHPYKPDWGYALHNSYLQIWQEIGFVGLIVVVTPIFLVLRSLSQARQIGERDRSLRNLYAGFAGVVVSGAFNAFFESWLIAPGNLGTLPFWLAMGIAQHMSTHRMFARVSNF